MGLVHRREHLTEISRRRNQHLGSTTPEMWRSEQVMSLGRLPGPALHRCVVRCAYPLPPAPPIVITPTVFSGLAPILAEKMTDTASDWASNPGGHGRESRGVGAIAPSARAHLPGRRPGSAKEHRLGLTSGSEISVAHVLRRVDPARANGREERGTGQRTRKVSSRGGQPRTGASPPAEQDQNHKQHQRTIAHTAERVRRPLRLTSGAMMKKREGKER